MWSFAGVLIVMVAHTWIMSARRVWYEAHREAVVVVVRFLTFTIPMAGYVLSGAWEVSRANLVVSRLLWGLLSTVGWHVDNLMSLVLQLTIFVMLRMGLALKVLVHDDNEIWLCSPLGLCWPTSRMPAARQAELSAWSPQTFSLAPSRPSGGDKSGRRLWSHSRGTGSDGRHPWHGRHRTGHG